MNRRIGLAAVLCLAGLCFIPNPVFPQELDVEYETAKKGEKAEKKKASDAKIVVTGTMSKKLEKTSPVKTEVVDRDRIDAKGATTLYEALNNELGLLIENNCQNCEMNAVRLNGLDGRYTQILFNGLPTVSSLAGVYLLQQIPAEMIERVEVVRGGGSALYGSGAIGGVINVIQRKPKRNGGSVEARYDLTAGNVLGKKDYAHKHTVSGTVSAVSDSGKAGIALWGSKSDRGAWDANGDGYSDLSEQLNKSMGGRAFFALMSGMELSFAGSTLYEQRRGGNELKKEPFDPAVNIAEGVTVNRDTGEVRLDQEVSSHFNYTLFYGYAGTKRHSYYGPAGNDVLSEDVNLYGRTENPYHVGGLVMNIIPVKGHTLTLGVEHFDDRLKDHNPGMNRELNAHYKNTGLYGQYDWDTAYLDLLLGVRADRHNELNEWNYSPRISGIIKFNPHLRWRNTVATGFKAPQVFDEDFHIEVSLSGSGTTNHLIVNDPNLKPERSVSYSTDVNADFKAGDFGFDMLLGGFYTAVSDAMAVDWSNPVDDGTNTYYTRKNESGKTLFYGGNAELGLSYPRVFRFSSGWTLQRAYYDRDKEYDNGRFNQVPKVPRVYGFSLLQLFFGPFQLAFSCQYMGHQYALYEGDSTELRKTGTFTVYNTRAEYKLAADDGRFVAIYAGVDNINDQYQKDLPLGQDRPAGYVYGPAKPLTIYGGARMGF